MPKSRIGQNFLYDQSILKKIIMSADLSAKDTVAEIGPGHGKLTEMLAQIVKKVIAIELDDALYERLNSMFILKDNIELVHDDALKFPFQDIGRFKVVANIPYYITTPLIFRLLEEKKGLKTMTLTVQKEVAERIVATPGGKDYGVLSIMVQYHAHPELKFIIPRQKFKPVPRVDSAVLHIRMLENPPVTVENETFFFKVVKTSFSQRRKTLANSLKGMRKDIRERLILSDIDPQRRPETLSLEEFARLSHTLLAGD
jgi:16S rRNA (adenine1518-N6/adenine1519-N6)-dimethyltransferase